MESATSKMVRDIFAKNVELHQIFENPFGIDLVRCIVDDLLALIDKCFPHLHEDLPTQLLVPVVDLGGVVGNAGDFKHLHRV